MTRRSRLTVSLAGGALCLAAFWLITSFDVGGERISAAAEDLTEFVAAAAAAFACLYAARQGHVALRRAWTLLGAGAAVWAAGQVVWTVFAVGQREMSFPSPADAGFIAALPLAVAGVLALPLSPQTADRRLRLVLDGGIVAASLLYIAWVASLSGQFAGPTAQHPERLLVLVYPAGDVLALTLILVAARRAAGADRILYALLGIGFIGLLVADGSLAYAAQRNGHGSGGAVAGWVIGFLVLGFAALWSLDMHVDRARAAEVELWELAIPWAAVIGVLAANTAVTLGGRKFGPEPGYIGTVLGVLFVAGQVLSVRDFGRLLGKSRRTEAELRDRTALLGEIIGEAPLGIARIDGNFRFIDANLRLSEMLGVPAMALVGAPLDQFISDAEMQAARERVAKMRTGELSHAQVDGAMTSADGTTLWVHRRITPVKDGDGAVRYFLVMFEDVTAKHDQEQAALDNLAALERLSRMKSEFMSMVSHEFRTALTGIQGYSELMTSEDMEPVDVKEYAGDINADALRLNRMITEMLDLDRIESGRMAMHMAPMDMNKLLGEAVDRARMSTKRHDIVLSLDPRLPEVEGDCDRLTQVVTNLLSNAVKYSPEGGEILVTSKMADGMVEVGVRDHGQGIPPQFRSRIFGRYERYEGNGANQPVGTGLGLAITQQIVQLHKGKIWVESEVGQGSTFHFTVPPAGPPTLS